MLSRSSASQLVSSAGTCTCTGAVDDDDDFQIPPTQTLSASLKPTPHKIPLKPSNTPRPAFKKRKLSANPGKENTVVSTVPETRSDDLTDLDDTCGLDLIPSSMDCSLELNFAQNRDSGTVKCDEKEKESLELTKGYLCNSIESKLIRPVSTLSEGFSEDCEEDNEFDELLKLCDEVEEEEEEEEEASQDEDNGIEEERNGVDNDSVPCPLCGVDISYLNEQLRLVHTNDCLDKVENPAPKVIVPPSVDKELHCLPEDLFNIGVTALGPRKKIVPALSELRKEGSHAAESHPSHDSGSARSNRGKMQTELSNVTNDETPKPAANKLITDFFPGLVSSDRKKVCAPPRAQHISGKGQQTSGKGQPNSGRRPVQKNHVKNGKLKNTPSWCCIPGTPFRVDAFRYLRGDCSHWFLTHFHMDHYQGLTKSFHHGKIYCSSITARLVNLKLGIPWAMLQVLPLNQKINISGIYITCLDANHCPGSIMILFEPPNGCSTHRRFSL